MTLSSTGGRVNTAQTEAMEAMEAYRGVYIYGTQQKEATFLVQMKLQSFQL